MGASHVSAVYARWGTLPDRAFRMLAYMALIAKDSTPEPSFWGGRDGLCIAIGKPSDDSSYRMARRVIADLEKAGAIKRTYRGHNGKRSEYVIILSPSGDDTRSNEPGKGDSTVPLDTDTSSGVGGLHSPPVGGQIRASRGTPQSGKGDSTVPPRRTKEERSESEEDISPLTQPSPSAHEDDDAKPEVSPLDAKRIVRKAVDRGVVVADLTDGKTFRTRTARDIYIATKLKRAAS